MIGRALCLALAKKGVFVTIADLSEERGKEVVSLVGKENAKFHSGIKFPSSQFILCDVTKRRDIASAFDKHLQTYGGLDICINSAGIATPVSFHKDKTDGESTWRRTVHINLIAVIDCTRVAIQSMQAAGKPGVIINLGSASGLYPMFADPIYSATKGGIILFTRSLVPYMRKGIRVNVLCPEFVETDLAAQVDSKFIQLSGGFLPMKMVVDERNRKVQIAMGGSVRKDSNVYKWSMIEKWFNEIHEAAQLVVHSITHNFRNATKITETQLSFPIEPQHVVVKVLYAGVNASDVNFSSGRYFTTSPQLPFDAGFEPNATELQAVGLIAAVGDSVDDLKVGSPVAIMTFGSYAEFTMVHSKHILPVARPDPEVVALLTSGLTASIALEKAAQMESGKVVLVTAAAGGTGQFAVQLAKLAGNKVVATCGGGQKAELLKTLGVDRVIDYRKEDVKSVLKKEFPRGMDVIYESVGGKMFDLCLNALAVYGRLVVIGMISQYQGEHGWQPSNYPGLCEKILAKSQTVVGFFLVQYSHLWREHLDRLFDLYSSGKLKVSLDPKKFLGLDSVADAVEYLHSGRSQGKVVVCVDPTFNPQPSKL
ncbi:hypothetical protein ACLOJK_016505 [Asimina triloba]